MILVAPPQHGKSEIVSRKFPAWALGKNPDLRIIAGSYSSSWAESLGSDVQRTMDSAEYHAIFPETCIAGNFSNKHAAKRVSDYFEVVDRKGFHRAAGRGVGVTGRSADVLLIDDPVKNAEEALSETTRESTWNWYLQDLYTRLQQGAGVLIMATRWHTDDLIGRLIEAETQGGDAWDVYIFPALSATGEALAPSRFDADALLRTKAALSSAIWSSLYDGSPTALEGNIFEASKWKYYGGLGQPALPDLKQFDMIVETWDGSFKDSAGSDFCAGQKWGTRGAERWLLAYVLEKMAYPRFKQAIRQLSYQEPAASYKLIEETANGAAVISELKIEIGGIKAIKPEGGKIARAWAASADQSAGNCFLPDPSIAPWVGGFVARCAAFPGNIDKAGQDDDIDAFTQMVNWCRTHGSGLFDLWRQQAEALKKGEPHPEGRPTLTPHVPVTPLDLAAAQKEAEDSWTTQLSPKAVLAETKQTPDCPSCHGALARYREGVWVCGGCGAKGQDKEE